VQIPRPEKFAIHKLIVADRRRDGPGSFKADKDRQQAAFIIETMAEDRPFDIWVVLPPFHRTLRRLRFELR
jgi:hypothetical protein